MSAYGYSYSRRSEELVPWVADDKPVGDNRLPSSVASRTTSPAPASGDCLSQSWCPDLRNASENGFWVE